MKKKTAKRTSLDLRIREAKSPHDKITLAHHGMDWAEFRAQTTALAREFFQLRRIDPTELEERCKREWNSAGKISLRSEVEWCALSSAKRRIEQFAYGAMMNWRPDAFEKLARAMRAVQRHNEPDKEKAWRRHILIVCNGKVGDALRWIMEQFPDRELESVRRDLRRLKRKLFQPDK